MKRAIGKVGELMSWGLLGVALLAMVAMYGLVCLFDRIRCRHEWSAWEVSPPVKWRRCLKCDLPQVRSATVMVLLCVILGTQAAPVRTNVLSTDFADYTFTNGILFAASSVNATTNLVACVYRWGTADRVTTVQTNTYLTNVYGLFWVEWQLETNCTERTRTTMQTFPVSIWIGSNVLYSYTVTNMMVRDVISWGFKEAVPGWWSRPAPAEPAWDAPQTETTYWQSNLWSYLVWRGRTNSDCLESVCIKTNTRTWHYERKKVYER